MLTWVYDNSGKIAIGAGVGMIVCVGCVMYPPAGAVAVKFLFFGKATTVATATQLAAVKTAATAGAAVCAVAAGTAGGIHYGDKEHGRRAREADQRAAQQDRADAARAEAEDAEAGHAAAVEMQATAAQAPEMVAMRKRLKNLEAEGKARNDDMAAMRADHARNTAALSAQIGELDAKVSMAQLSGNQGVFSGQRSAPGASAANGRRRGATLGTDGAAAAKSASTGPAPAFSRVA